MTARYLPPSDRTREILEDLEAVRENLLALSENVWTSIDRQDLAAFDDGVRFMRIYLEKMTAFDQLASDISALIQQYTSVRLEAGEQIGGGDRAANERIIQELDREQAHGIDEDFPAQRVFNREAVYTSQPRVARNERTPGSRDRTGRVTRRGTTRIAANDVADSRTATANRTHWSLVTVILAKPLRGFVCCPAFPGCARCASDPGLGCLTPTA